MKGLRILAVLAVLAGAALAEDPATAIKQKLESEFKLTKVNADKTDIVTAGSVILLHKDSVVMVAASSSANPCMNTYRDGKIGGAAACTLPKKLPSFLKSRIPGADKAPDTHTFVDGEKFWMTKIDIKASGKDRGAVFDFFTDAIGDPGTRYVGRLTIPFGADMPSPDDALKLVQTVLTVDASNDAKADTNNQPAQESAPQQAPAAPSQPASAPAAQAPATPALEAPPPPPADPVNVAEGQTIAQVEAALGQPVKKLTVGAKVIYVYKDLKITFVKGKVSNVE